jgi:hypothetical protein
LLLPWQVDKRDGSGEKVLMQSRRIDGGTTLEAREAAIQEFNRPDTGAVRLLRIYAPLCTTGMYDAALRCVIETVCHVVGLKDM